MINLLLGQPGGGKSYEAVAYHVIPAIEAGRKVKTNLPLNLEYFYAVYPQSKDLIEIVEDIKGHEHNQNTGLIRAFADIHFYGDPWRHPETGVGALYVIDECHFCLRRGSTSVAVEEWFSMHRHELADVLLITQSYGKVDKNIIDLVQLCYRVKKATAFGSDKKYIRKVQDGVRGEVMNTGFRDYEPHIFPFYKSHTLSDNSAQEAQASDVKPFWKSWTMIIAAICLVFGIPFSVMSFSNMTKVDNVEPVVKNPTPVPAHPQQLVFNEPSITPNQQPPPEPEPEPEIKHPYSKLKLHVKGILKSEERDYSVVQFVASQNAKVVFNLTDTDLILAGYSVELVSACLVMLSYEEYREALTCNSPSHGMKNTKDIMSRES